MTRRTVYSVALVAFLAACAMTLTSIVIPRWISWNSETPNGEHIHYTYGLHKRCSSLTHMCEYFPQPDDCSRDRYFCSMWRSVGFLMSFAVVGEGVMLVAYVVIMGGGKQKMEGGWRILSGMLFLVGLIQCAGMAIIVSLTCQVNHAQQEGVEISRVKKCLADQAKILQAHLYENDDRFFPGWKLDTSWILCTASWSIMVILAGTLAASALVLPPEGGYELIPDHEHDEWEES